jgi:hypothetical protein
VELRWRLFPDPKQSHLNAGCDVPDDRWAELGARLRAMAANLWAGLVRITEAEPTACRPLLTMQTHSWNLEIPASDGVRHWHLLRDRVVFFGVAARDGNDLHAVPGYGKLAGVQFHAQAFENLLRAGQRYIAVQPAESILGAQVDAMAKVELFIWVLVALAATFCRRSVKAVATWAAFTGRRRVYAAGALAYGLAIVAVLSRQPGTPAAAVLQVGLVTLLPLIALALLKLSAIPREPPQAPALAWLLARLGLLLREILPVVLLAGIAVLCNETLLRMAGADWLTFVILYVVLRRELEDLPEPRDPPPPLADGTAAVAAGHSSTTSLPGPAHA